MNHLVDSLNVTRLTIAKQAAAFAAARRRARAMRAPSVEMPETR